MADEDKTKSEPTSLEEPTPTTTEPTQPVDVDGMISELEKVGVSNPEDLSKKLEASQQSGRLAQLLGDERKRVQDLEDTVAKLQTQPQQPQTSYEDPFDAPSGQPIDLEAAIARGVDKVLTDREQKQTAVQQANLRRWNQINSDKDYHLVRDVWEEKLKDPNFVMQVQQGMVDPYGEYIETVRGYYKGVAQRSLKTIQQLHGGGETTPPHVETGERVPTNIVSEGGEAVPDSIKRTRELKEKVDKGYVLEEQDEKDIIDSLMFAPPVSSTPALDPRKK